MEESTRKRIQVAALMLVCAAAWYLSLLIRGRVSPLQATAGENFAAITTAITVGAFSAIAFVKWVWRWRALHPWLVDTPLVAGNWKGRVLRSQKSGEPSAAEFPITVTVTQPSIGKVLFVQTMDGNSAEGHTEACELYKATDGKFYLEGIYQVTKNEDNEETNGGRSIYFGAMRHQLNDNTYPTAMAGSYWSESATRGRVELDRVPQQQDGDSR